jgi:hypothetical protein
MSQNNNKNNQQQQEQEPEPTKSVYDQIEEEAKKAGKFVKLTAGEKLTLQFVTEPQAAEKIRIVDREYTDQKTGKTTKTKKVQYTVIDPRNPSEEKLLELALRYTGQLNALLKKGMKLVEVQRNGAGTSTSYVFIPL